MFSKLPQFLLASSSPYRANLLNQIGLKFDSYSPNIDESPKINELPLQLAQRLSAAKAEKASEQYPQHIIIASDQVACLAGTQTPIGKPYNAQNAIAQLSTYSGKTLHFYTALSVFAPSHYANSHASQRQTIVESYSVNFRTLSSAQIRNYVEIDKPFDCAGSFKAESIGISLFESFSGRDHNSLIGLPLMALIELLNNIGIDVLDLQMQYAEQA
ncbi:nucleoside triphosphate pyrophosphatase [Glaciecola sp. SC05]|uniref:Maf family protein n=1 Tax=Glaciecola sp. SC05 TaxID=1987355 RepID=UPI0035285D9E